MSGASASTATGTTATAEPAYVGRFAPSPTGALHLGSLVAAVASYVDARHHGGRWLLRMEDLDTPRVLPRCRDAILRTLEAFGLEWDGAVVYQSERTELYRDALSTLRSRGAVYECSCTRRELVEGDEGRYPGTCRQGSTRPGPTATRFRVDDTATVELEDHIQGICRFDLGLLGDFVVRRRDGIIAYQLAVVVDDAQQGVTDVVRGADLLQSTAWQIVLQQVVGLPTLRYAHVPLIVEPNGNKLSKSRRSVSVDAARVVPQLVVALQLLQQSPPDILRTSNTREVLAWAICNWRPMAIHAIKAIQAPT